MKKAVFVFLLLLLLPLASAIEFEMKQDFKQGETLMAKVVGNFLDAITDQNVFLYRGHVRVPLDFDVAKINDDFYIYAQLLGKATNNYSVQIRDVRYMKLGEITEETLIKNFSITEEIADFSIDPGFVVTDDDFSIQVQNLKDTSITIEVIENRTQEQGFFGFLSGGEEKRTYDVRAGGVINIDFYIENITNTTFQFIKIKTDDLGYEVPAYVSVPENKTQEDEEKSYRFEPSTLNISLATDSAKSKIIYLYNDGEVDLENITLSVSGLLNPYVSFSVEEIEKLEVNESIKITLEISSENEEKFLEGQITASDNESFRAYSALHLNFIKDYIPSEDENETEVVNPAILETCEELNGTICGKGEKCSGDEEPARDGNCCFATCEQIEEDTGWKVVGWIIIIIVIVLIYWFFKKKYRGARKPLSLLKVAKGKKH